MTDIELVLVKQVVVDTINKRMDVLKKDRKKWNGIADIVTKSIDAEKHKLFNIQTEICINLDDKFEK